MFYPARLIIQGIWVIIQLVYIKGVNLLKMSAKQYYLIHVFKQGTEMETRLFYSRKATVSFLRCYGAKFANDDFDLYDDRVCFDGYDGLFFEVEGMERKYVDQSITHQGVTYVPIADYCRMKGVSESMVRYAISTKKMQSFSIGTQNSLFVEMGVRL